MFTIGEEALYRFCVNYDSKQVKEIPIKILKESPNSYLVNFIGTVIEKWVNKNSHFLKKLQSS